MTLHINLAETQKRSGPDPVTIVLALLLVLAAVACTAWSGRLEARIAAERRAVADAEEGIRQVESSLPHLEEMKGACERLRGQLEAFRRLASDPPRHAALLAEVGEVLPLSAWLTSMAVDPAAGKVTLGGTAAGTGSSPPFATVARLLEALEESPRFEGATLASTARTDLAGLAAPAATFQIEVTYR